MIKEAIVSLVDGNDLSADEAGRAMSEIMSGEATPAQFAAFVTALRMKGETVDEIVGLARGMREKSLHVNVSDPVVDTCGTGGDGANTFNISTTAAFVVAGAGLKIAKHGNRAMTSQSGSADVLEALGVKIDLQPEAVERCLNETGIGFMFAQVFHPAMKHAAGPRREIGIRTVFNILGPLTNPANAQAQVLGVGEEGLTQKMGEVLLKLGCRHAVVVHGTDGLDELSIGAPSLVAEVHDGALRIYTVDPSDFGFSRAGPDQIRGGSPAENAELTRRVLSGRPGPHRDIVALNAAAGLLAGDLVSSLGDGVVRAQEVIDSGAALAKLDALAALSQSL